MERICVVGLGYVGLPLVVALGSKFSTVGFDINEQRVRELRDNFDLNGEHSSSDIDKANVKFVSSLDDAGTCTVFIVTVPTPIDLNYEPDLNPLRGACEILGPVLKRGDLVVFESTVYPGCTEGYCGPLLEKYSGLQQGEEFHLGYSPERINPGDKVNTIETITKIVSGNNEETLERVSEIYSSIIDAGIYKAETIQVAEAAKLTENIQRDVNIALMNELSSVFGTMGIRTRQVLNAAGTKWNFIPFRPGMVGGHCIGVDPYYLIEIAKQRNIPTPLLQTARSVNEGVVSRIIEHFEKNVTLKYKRSLILGLTFKENCNDIRNSKAFELAQELSKRTNVHAVEPNIDDIGKVKFELVNNFSGAPYDCVIIAVQHHQFLAISKEDLLGLIDQEGHIFDLHDCFKLEEENGFCL